LLKKLLLYLFCILFLAGNAQGRKRNFRQRELGFFGGGSYYIGDVNPRGHFLYSHPAGGVYFRYMTNYRFAFRFGASVGTLSGDDASSGERDQKERNLNFRTQIYDFHSVAEFNFVEYRIGHDRYKFTLFVFAGLGGFYFDPQGNQGDGYVSLRDQKTEGQSRAYPKFQMSIPFGVGLKWNMGDKWGMGVEWGPRRTFTDYLDDIKGNYPDAPAAGEANVVATGAHAPGTMRGNPSTRDWYFFYGVTLSFKLKGYTPCHKGF
jgi:hypothetical protein